MGMQVEETPVVSAFPVAGHLEPQEIAAFIDRTLDEPARARIESHLASCDACRSEMVAATRIVSTLPDAGLQRARNWIPAAAAAAAVVLFIILPRSGRVPESERHREAPVTTTVAPRAIAPRGVVDGGGALTWSSVPHTDSYRVRVFDADGSVLWERETTDTTAALSALTRCVARPCYWKVEARTGFDRSTASELTEFSIRPARHP